MMIVYFKTNIAAKGWITSMVKYLQYKYKDNTK